MSVENPKYWALEGDDVLEYGDISKRLQDYFDLEFMDDKIPEEIEMTGYDPVPITTKPEHFIDEVVENILNSLDDNYNTSTDDPTDPTESMKDAALEFVKKILSEYMVKDCVQVCKKTIKVFDYLDKSDIEI